MSTKYVVEIPIKVSFYLTDECDAEEFYKGILCFFEQEALRLKSASGTERWPSGIMMGGAHGTGAVKLAENILRKNNIVIMESK